MTNTIHIAYALDDAFLEYTCVSAVSLLANTKRNVCFHILESRLSDEGKEKLRLSSGNRRDVEWQFHHINQNEIGFSTHNVSITDETYYRLALPDICAKLDKVLYIDGDTIVNRDIAELYDTELDEYMAAAAYEDSPYSIDPIRRDILEFGEEDRYFQAGVLLINLKLCRSSNLYNNAVSCVIELRNKFIENGVYWMDDQDVLNYLLKGKIKYLPPKYNFCLYNRMGIIGDNFYCVREWAEAMNNFVILHNCGRSKPVIRGREAIWNPHYELYYKYKNISPVKDDKDIKRISEYKKSEASLESGIVLNSIDYINFNKFKTIEYACEVVKKEIGNRKLIIWGNTENVRLLIVMFAHAGLSVNGIVDGLVKNEGKRVFDHLIESPNFLYGKSKEYFVVTSMIQMQVFNRVRNVLSDYGYEDSDTYYVFEKSHHSLSDCVIKK
ncbi:MAG: glycosyltransferase family 8 protein [Clostridiales bacterium]|jgi:lipopolysaccharide biosynthesis glycosyltransferase|nr:glycosyltransferase family 8 protein [Clostridiales bacterium]